MKTHEKIEAYFTKQQLEQRLPLGDVRLTITQQQEIIDAVRDSDKDEMLERVLGCLRDIHDNSGDMAEALVESGVR